MNFTLDDIEYLAINGGRNRLDKTGEYDISYYENYIREDIQTIEELIKYIDKKITEVQDEKTRNYLINILDKYVKRTCDEVYRKNPREESNKKGSTGVGYLESHPHALYIENDMPKYVERYYPRIIKFMNELYAYSKYTEQQGMNDSYVLYDMFRKTKDASKNLGIRCIVIGQQLYEIIAEGDIEKMSILEMGRKIVDDNIDEPMINDIQIACLPYTVELPTFSYAGVGETYKFPVSNPSSTIWYNKSYLDNLNNDSKEVNSMLEEKTNSDTPRLRNPQESDEDYTNYLKDFYGRRI